MGQVAAVREDPPLRGHRGVVRPGVVGGALGVTVSLQQFLFPVSPVLHQVWTAPAQDVWAVRPQFLSLFAPEVEGEGGDGGVELVVAPQHPQELRAGEAPQGVRGLHCGFLAEVQRTFWADKLVDLVPLGVGVDQLALTLVVPLAGEALHGQGEGVPGVSARANNNNNY